MTLLFADGFDHYNTTTQMARKWDGAGTGSTLASGRNGSGWQTPSSTTFKSVANKQTLIEGFAFKFIDTPSGTIASFKDTSTVQVDLVINSNGSISVRRNASTVLGTSAISLVHINTWHYIEWKALIDNAAGTVDVQLDGTNVLSLTGQDTQQSANAYADRVALEYPGVFLYLDDLYICDDAGATNNTFLGDTKIETLMPDGAGTTTQWTPSAGSNFQNVDEDIQDDDSTYNESSTVGQIDLYAYEALATTNGTVLAVQANLVAEKTDANVRQIRENCRAGTTTYNAGTTFTLASGYLDHRFIRETNPNGGAAWTIAGVNSSEWGVEVVA